MTSFTTPFAPPEGGAEQAPSLRPTLYIGLGGFGCSVLRRLKREIQATVPDQLDGYAFLGLDTHRQAANDELSATEYIALSIGVRPDEVAKNHPERLGWYREIAGSFRTRSIETGADQVKPVGRLALLQPAALSEYRDRLQLAQNRLSRFRERFAAGKPPKVYVIATLAGGTGSGCLIDALALTGEFFATHAGGDFPYQGIFLTPDVLVGEATPGTMPLLYTNTYATLLELNHMLTSREVVSYDGGALQRLEISRRLLPDPIHLIGDRNEEGTAVASRIEELADIVVSYLLSEVATPLEEHGTEPRVHDRENPFGLTLDQGEMAYRSFSSFGVVRCGFPARELARFAATELIDLALGGQLARAATASDDGARWIDAQRLREAGADQLQDALREGDDPDALRVALDARGELLGRNLPHGKLAAAAKAHAGDWRKRLQERQGQQLRVRAEAIDARLEADLDVDLSALARDAGVGAVLARCEALEAHVKAQRSALQAELAAAQKVFSLAEQQLDDSLRGVAAAVEGWLGRRRRIEDALSDFGHRLENVFALQIDVWVKERGGEIYAGLLESLQDARRRWLPVEERTASRQLAARRANAQLRVHLDQLADVARRGRGNQFSLLDSRGAWSLYQELFAPDAAALSRSLHDRWWNEGGLAGAAAKPEVWLEEQIEQAIAHEVGPRLDKLDLLGLMDRFVPTEAAKRELFQKLRRLSAPLFDIDPNRREASYEDHWIVAIHPELERRFDDAYRRLLPGMGVSYARFANRLEVVLYQLRFGFTLPSLRRLPFYESHYERQLRYYLDGHPKKPVKPVHGWPDAHTWERLLPRPEEDEAIRLFALGRAFNHLYPTPGKEPSSPKNRAFVSARGSAYSVENGDGADVDLGRGLTNAVRAFAERPDFQEGVRRRIEAKVTEVGAEAVRKRLEEDYLPMLAEQLEVSTDRERAELLRRMRRALDSYRADELAQRAV